MDSSSAPRYFFNMSVGIGSSEHDFEGALFMAFITTSLDTTSKEDINVSQNRSFTCKERSLVG